jgi:hypothetical protein
MRHRRFLWIAPFAVASVFGQVEVYSEFRRPGPDGRLVRQDAAGTAREILSPAVARNAYSTYFVVIHGSTDQKVTLYLGANPEGAVLSTLYRAQFDENGVPDALDKLTPPFYELLPNGVAVFVVDVFVPPDAPVRRLRFEVQYHDGDHWIIYPMELRVMAATVPRLQLTTGQLAPLAASTAATSIDAFRPFLCGSGKRTTPAELNVRSLLRRNASQDLALARKIEAQQGRAPTEQAVLRALGATDARAWCSAGKPPENPELYLQVRDYLLRTAMN